MATRQSGPIRVTTGALPDDAIELLIEHKVMTRTGDICVRKGVPMPVFELTETGRLLYELDRIERRLKVPA
jgi:hypothetical protein